MQDYVVRLLKAFFGSANNAADQPPQQPWYTPEEIAQSLCSLPDSAFDEYVFQREPLRDKLNADLRRQLAQNARESGRQAARQLKNQYPHTTVEELCKQLGCTVERRPMPQDGGRVLYAQFVQPGEITLFTHCLDTAAQWAKPTGLLTCLQRPQLEPVLLAHELYHVVEERSPQLFAAAYRLRLWQLGPLHNDSPLVCLSEIAAMAFAKELTGLEFCPYALDALLLYGYDPAGACMVRDEIMEHQGEQIQCEQTLKSGKKG